MLVMATIGVHAQFSISNSTQRRVIVAYRTWKRWLLQKSNQKVG